MASAVLLPAALSQAAPFSNAQHPSRSHLQYHLFPTPSPRCRTWRIPTLAWRCLRARKSSSTWTTHTAPESEAQTARSKGCGHLLGSDHPQCPLLHPLPHSLSSDHFYIAVSMTPQQEAGRGQHAECAEAGIWGCQSLRKKGTAAVQMRASMHSCSVVQGTGAAEERK